MNEPLSQQTERVRIKADDGREDAERDRGFAGTCFSARLSL
jgi:hypothetical protein